MKRWCCFCPLLQTSPFMNGWVGSKSMVFTIEPMGNTSQEIYNATLDMLLQQVYKARIENYVSNFTKSSSFTISFSIFQLHQHFPNFHSILCQVTKHCFDSWYSVPIVITVFLVNKNLIIGHFYKSSSSEMWIQITKLSHFGRCWILVSFGIF